MTETPRDDDAPTPEQATTPVDQEIEVPEAPVEAEVTGDAAEASKVEADGERPAPPARAKDPEPGATPQPGVDSIGTGAPDPQAEAEPASEEEVVLEETPRVKPEIPGADLEPDIVPEGGDALLSEEEAEEAERERLEAEEAEEADQPIAVTIDLAAGARYPSKGYIAGKRKSAIARVFLRPGNGEFRVNGRPLAVYFPRPTLQRTILQPLETVGYETRMDVVAKIHGGGVSSQADALRHGIARALLDADPNLRGELKRRGFLTRDARVKERRKAGLKKARKRPQFSKR